MGVLSVKPASSRSVVPGTPAEGRTVSGVSTCSKMCAWSAQQLAEAAAHTVNNPNRWYTSPQLRHRWCQSCSSACLPLQLARPHAVRAATAGQQSWGLQHSGRPDNSGESYIHT